MIIVLVGLLVYLPVWIWTIHIAYTQTGHTQVILPVLGSDSQEYSLLATGLKSNHCFSLDMCQTAETFRTIGYPLFVVVTMLFFNNLFFTTFVQCALVLVTGYLLFSILNQFTSLKLSSIGLLLFLLNPNVIQHALLILSDTVFVFLIVWAFYLTICREGRRNAVFAGVIIGLSILVRPVSIFILPLYTLADYFFNAPSYRVLVKNFLLSFVGLGVIVFPWVIRNYIQTGAYGVSSVSSYNALYYNVPMFIASKTGRSVEDVRNELIRNSGVPLSELKDLSASDSLLKTASKNVWADPIGYGVYHIAKTIPFFFGSSIKNIQLSYNLFYDDDMDRQFTESSISDALLSFNIKKTTQVLWKEGGVLLERLAWLLLVVLSFVGLWDNKRRSIVVVSLLFVFYFAILTGPVSYVRYRLPAEPFIFIAALAGVALLLERYFSRVRS